MSSLNPTTVTHTESFNVVDSVDGARVATREILKNGMVEQLNKIEPFIFRNSYLANETTGGNINSRGLDWMTVNESSPAGSYRSFLTPKGTMEIATAINSMADITFRKSTFDEVVLYIDNAFKTNTELIYPMDASKGGGWLISNIDRLVTTKLITAAVRNVNVYVYTVIKKAAFDYISPKTGAAGNVKIASNDKSIFTDNLIDDINEKNALPEDRYVSGFDPDQLIVIIDQRGHSKILKEKLQIYDGQFMGWDGSFFNNLPTMHLFAGAYLYKTKFLNYPDYRYNQAPNYRDIFIEYIVMPLGEWSPLLFDMPYTIGYADIIPGSGNAIAIYAWQLFGANVPSIMSQYITMRVSELPDPNYTGRIENVTLKSTSGDGTKLTLKGNAKAYTGGVVPANVLYKFAEYDKEMSATWSSTAVTGDEFEQVISNLKQNTEYRFLVAPEGLTPGQPLVETVGSKEYIITLYNYTSETSS